ncbi:MAG: DUF302 domain-containing protein [Chloroflexi bacterium]|nr:DUF302 domain-containing protein [Chloroflexota bacterium]
MADAQVKEPISYGFGKKVSLPYAEAVEATRVALKEQGFGVLTEIDIKQTMKEKRGIDFRPYIILGACNPPLAEKALGAELDIGLLLPCNVVIYAGANDEGGSVVKAMDPEVALGIVDNVELAKVALEAKSRLQKALQSLPG